MSAALLVSLALIAAPPEDFDTFFANFVEKRAGVEILQADILEETAQYGGVTSRRGTLIFGKPRRIIFRYEGDEPSMMIDDRRVYEFDPFEEQLQVIDIEDSLEASLFFLGFDSDPKALKEAYDVRLFSVKSDQGQRGIEIRPYKEDINAVSFVSVSIYLRDSDYLPYRIEIEIDDDTRLVTEISNHNVNAAIEPSLTQLRIPAGTRVIENNEVTIRSVPDGGLLVPESPLAVATAPSPTPAPAPVENAPAVAVQELPAP